MGIKKTNLSAGLVFVATLLSLGSCSDDVGHDLLKLLEAVRTEILKEVKDDDCKRCVVFAVDEDEVVEAGILIRNDIERTPLIARILGLIKISVCQEFAFLDVGFGVDGEIIGMLCATNGYALCFVGIGINVNPFVKIEDEADVFGSRFNGFTVNCLVSGKGKASDHRLSFLKLIENTRDICAAYGIDINVNGNRLFNRFLDNRLLCGGFFLHRSNLNCFDDRLFLDCRGLAGDH